MPACIIRIAHCQAPRSVSSVHIACRAIAQAADAQRVLPGKEGCAVLIITLTHGQEGNLAGKIRPIVSQEDSGPSYMMCL